MSAKPVGVVTISQSPRADLVLPVQAQLREHQIIEAGALDELTLEEITSAPPGAYPLTTRLRDGSLVVVDEEFLAPRLQQAVERLEAAGVSATYLACAGPFAQVQGSQPLIKPFWLASAMLRAIGIQRIGVVVPTESQRDAATAKWNAAGFTAAGWTLPGEVANAAEEDLFLNVLGQIGETAGIECIVLDYVGHPLGYVKRVQAATRQPVLDLGHLAISSLASIIGRSTA